MKIKERKFQIFTEKSVQATKIHPLQNEKEVSDLKEKVKKKGNLTKTYFDPLSFDPLTSGEQSNLEDLNTKEVPLIKDLHQDAWRNQRKETVASYSSKNNLPAITVLPGENSPRHVSVR